MNWFFLEEHFYYGQRVDAFLFSVPNSKLEAHLLQVVREEWYDIGSILSPMLVPSGRADEPHASTLWQANIPQGDHWAVIAQNAHLARFMMSRPLPTQGMQALAAALQLGFSDITLVGVDMYSSSEQRYGHVIPDDVQRALEIKDVTPGYESAHSLDRDLEFLDTCIAQYPAAKIRQIGPSPHLQARLPLPQQRGRVCRFASVPGNEIAATAKPVFRPRYTSTGILEVQESAPLPYQIIDGKRCCYATMVSGPTFHHGTRALARSLARVSDVPLLALCTPSANAAALRTSQIATLTVPEIINPNVLKSSTNRFSSTYTKLHAFGITHVDRVVFLDSDMIVLQNIDELFSGTGFAAVFDHGTEYNYGRFNSGLFAVDPSRQLFDALMAEVGRVRSYDSGDQGFLNQMFPDWQRLPHEFNVNKRWSTLHPLAFNLAAARVLHFVGVKPWQPDVPTEFDELYELWFDQLSEPELSDLAKSLRSTAALAIKDLNEQVGRPDPGLRRRRVAFRRRGKVSRPDGTSQVSLLRRVQAEIRSGSAAEALELIENEWPGDERATAGLFRERAKALVLSGRFEAGYLALADAAERFPRNIAIQKTQHKLDAVMRARQASGGLVSERAVALAGRLYTKAH